MSRQVTTYVDGVNQATATVLLDREFPLRSGSHSEVSTYLVYFDHLMAIKSDGTTTSMVTTSHFEDADGSLDGPTAIVLNNGEMRIQVRMRRCRRTGNTNHPCIEDMRVETLALAS